MRVAYVASRYPHLSHTFIRREVEALRALGSEVHTFSVRPSETAAHFAPADEEAARTTTYLLPASPWSIARAHLGALRRSPGAYRRTLAATVRTSPPGARNRLWRVFYFVEGVILWAHCQRRGIRHLHAHFANVGADVARVAARLGNEVGDEHADGPRWSWSFTMHGPTELYDVTGFELAGKAADADAVVCISDYCRSQLMYLTPPSVWDRFHVVHCGVDPAVFRPVEGTGTERGLHVLSVGRLEPAKGFQVLVVAMARLRDGGVDARLTVVGGGSQEQALRRLVEDLDLGDRVDLVGAVPTDEVASWYPRADVFCMGSFAEGVPVVLMEAMASGLPVVAPYITGVPELVEDGVSGLLVPPGRADLLAEALQSLTDPQRRTLMGWAGRKRVQEAFDITALGPEVHAVLAGLPGTGGRSTGGTDLGRSGHAPG